MRGEIRTHRKNPVTKMETPNSTHSRCLYLGAEPIPLLSSHLGICNVFKLSDDLNKLITLEVFVICDKIGAHNDKPKCHCLIWNGDYIIMIKTGNDFA